MSAPPVHLHIHSAFSFLDGCAYPEAMLEHAAELGFDALALTDHNNLSGAVRFVRTAQELGIKPILGSEINIASSLSPRDEASDFHLTLLAATSKGYENLCRIITGSYLLGGRRSPAASNELLEGHSEGLIALSGCRRSEISRLLVSGRTDEARRAARRMKSIFKDAFFIEIQRTFLPHEERLIRSLRDLAAGESLAVAATNNAHYLHREDLPVHDILTCVRTLSKVDEPNPLRPFNAEQFLLPPKTFEKRFADIPEALACTRAIADMCDDVTLDISKPDMPHPAICEGTPEQFLRKLVMEGARRRYSCVSPTIQARLDKELFIINHLHCEPYMLVVWDIVREAVARGIRLSGRGSVVDSAVAHCLGISDIDPISNNLPFERFMSLERSQLPDIDIDFPRERRDELAIWVQQRYGQDHVGGVCTYSTFRARSALRELGKAMGLPMEEIGVLAKRIRGSNADEIVDALGSQPQAIHQQTSAKRYTQLFELCARVAGLPRMISTHLAGIVVTSKPILSATPLQPTAKGVVRIAHFDKDDIEAIGLKMDLLSLPILGAVDQAHEDCPYESIPQDDDETFKMIRSGGAIGAFELQSPAQRALHSRVQTSSKKDIIDSIALIRPGPGMGGMTDNYIRRRLGLEPVTYLHPSLEEPLKHTFGIIVFQEQVIEVACAAAKFTPGEADILRKQITHARSRKSMEKLREGFMQKALANGLSHDVAEKVFKCIAGFAGYGFAEGHARAFGEIAYRSSYLLTHHPAHYIAGLLNNQPMGFYPPNTLLTQARIRGVMALPPDINLSDWYASSTSETIRIGFRQIRGIPEKLGQIIHSQAPFSSVEDFCRKCRPDIRTLESLVMAGAFDSLHSNRRALLWQAETAARLGKQREVGDIQGALAGADLWPSLPEIPDFNDFERLSLEYSVMAMNPDCHLISLMRPKFDAMGLLTSKDLDWIPGGQKVRIAGLTMCPHTPPTKSGTRVLFFCLEDEFGLVDITAFEQVYRSSGYLAFSEPVLIVEGTLQKRGLGRAVLADRVLKAPKTLTPEEASSEVMKLPEPRINAAAR